jgi:hypothetical protein
MMKFGSRVDVLLDSAAHVQVKVGERVRGGESILAFLQPQSELLGVTKSGVDEKRR